MQHWNRIIKRKRRTNIMCCIVNIFYFNINSSTRSKCEPNAKRFTEQFYEIEAMQVLHGVGDCSVAIS